MTQPRATYAEAGRAQREAMTRLNAVAIDAKQMAYWQITATAISLVGTYSRVSDTVRRATVAEICGTNTKQVSRALAWAAKHGIVTWAEGKAGGEWCLSLPTPWTEDAGNCPGVETEPLDTSEAGSVQPPGQVAQGSVQPSEKAYEKKTEKNPPAPQTFEDDPDVEWWEVRGDEPWLWEQNAAQVAWYAAEDLGCPPDQWWEEPTSKRALLERRIVERFRRGEAREDIGEALVAVPAPPSVLSWAGLLLSREAKVTLGAGQSRRSA